MLLAVSWIVLHILSFSWTIVQARAHPPPDVDLYEDQYIKDQEYKLPNTTVKLIGYKKIKIPADELEEFEEHYFKNYDEYHAFGSQFYDRPTSELRVYFPVAAALLEHKGALIEANHLGEFEIEDIRGSHAVVGRKKTDHIHGVDGNIIKDGIIYLVDKPVPKRKIGKIYVYDFGYKSLDHHHDHDDDADGRDPYVKRDEPGKKGCLANHGGINCSAAYGIHNGRCPNNPKTCMDYNGYLTDCKKEHKVRYFLGSDCSVSLKRGHCWNEVMDSE